MYLGRATSRGWLMTSPRSSQAGSSSSMLMVAWHTPSANEERFPASSSAPAAPMVWPIKLLVLLIRDRSEPPNTFRNASHSCASPDVVPVAYRPQGRARPEVAPPAEEPSLMPDLRGRSAREAAIAAARRGLAVELRGSGQVVAQSPEAGSEVEPGSTCVLTLAREEGRQ